MIQNLSGWNLVSSDRCNLIYEALLKPQGVSYQVFSETLLITIKLVVSFAPVFPWRSASCDNRELVVTYDKLDIVTRGNVKLETSLLAVFQQYHDGIPNKGFTQYTMWKSNQDIRHEERTLLQLGSPVTVTELNLSISFKTYIVKQSFCSTYFKMAERKYKNNKSTAAPVSLAPEVKITIYNNVAENGKEIGNKQVCMKHSLVQSIGFGINAKYRLCYLWSLALLTYTYDTDVYWHVLHVHVHQAVGCSAITPYG